MPWQKVVKVAVAVLTGGAIGGTASTVTGGDDISIAVNAFVTSLITLIALLKRSPRDE